MDLEVQDVAKNWAKYIDDYGLIVQKNGDGGDSLNRTSVSAFLNILSDPQQLPPYYYQLIQLGSSTEPGKFRRSRHPNKWYSNFDRTSRDQLIPLVILLGWMNNKTVLCDVFKDHLKRGLLFAYNTRRNFQYPTLEEQKKYSTPDVEWDYSWKLPDLTGPEFWALYIRGFNLAWLLPVLVVFDLYTLLGAVILRLFPKDDVINHSVVLEYAKRRIDTPVMKLARVITPRSFLQVHLDNFFGVDQESPINELFRNLK